MLFNGYYFISKQYITLDKGIKESKKAYINSQKKLIKREVDSIFDRIDYRQNYKKSLNSEKEIIAFKQDLKEWIRTVEFGNQDENYLMVYKIEDYNGGDKFAKLLINKNRPDLEGKYISDNYVDINGKKFRKKFLSDIKKKGYSFVDYMYKKPYSTLVRPKVTYFRLYKKWNWVVAAGVYIDDIDSKIATKNEALHRTLRIEITSAIVLFLFFSLLANAFAIFLGEKIERYLESYKAQVKEKTDELQDINKTLEYRIQKEVQKNRDQEQFLIEKSKFIALGEMISNIAHQWRQPLSELSAIMMNLKFRYDLEKLDSKTMEEKNKEAENILEYMSKTIDDFRDFFMPSKEKKNFFVLEAVNSVINIVNSSLEEKKISLHVEIPKHEKIFGHKNEFEQVILNIITNAKQVLMEKKINQPKIEIIFKSDEIFNYICISDNAEGIKVEPIEKIFEPYFTTKELTGGTGIGLYMSKLIIEKNINGELSAKNSEDGAVFEIKTRRVN